MSAAPDLYDCGPDGSHLPSLPSTKRLRHGRSAYPRAFATPEGRMVSIAAMREALRRCRAHPDAPFEGWNWYPTQGAHVILAFRRGLHDRINLRGGA